MFNINCDFYGNNYDDSCVSWYFNQIEAYSIGIWTTCISCIADWVYSEN